MGNDEKIFKSADEINNEILETLKVAKEKLDSLFNTHQRISDLRAGLVFRKGLYIPLKSHRILIDGYEVQFLSMFNDFFSEMMNGGENLFKEFAIRTIAEMGLKDSQIIYSSDLSDEEKNRFKTIIMLGDYAFLGFRHPGRTTEYKKLFGEQKHLLSENQSKLFEAMDKCLTVKDYEEHKKLIKKIRKLVDSERNDLCKKTKTPKIFRTENIEAFFSAFSHLIHGNIILLTDLFGTKRPKNRNRLRITWTLMITGVNTLIHVKGFLERKGVKLEVGDLFERFDEASKELAKYWESIEK